MCIYIGFFNVYELFDRLLARLGAAAAAGNNDDDKGATDDGVGGNDE